MQTFTDSEGRRWDVAVNGWTIRKVKQRLDILLTEIFDNEFKMWIELGQDMLTLGAILWICCEDQAEKAGVSEEEFFMGIGSNEVYDAAGRAFFHSVVNFSQNPHGKQALQRMVRLTDNVQTKAMGVAEGMFAKEMDKAEANVDLLVEKYITSLSLSPESSESTQTDLPTVKSS